MMRIKDASGKELRCRGKIEIDENGITANRISVNGLDFIPSTFRGLAFPLEDMITESVTAEDVLFPLTVGGAP